MGLNEFAGYLAVGVAGVLSGVAASRFGLRAGAAYPGLAIAAIGFLLSMFVRDTAGHVRLEASKHASGDSVPDRPGLSSLVRRSLWSDANLFSVSEAGFVNNLNDGLAWGVFPLLFVASGLSLREMSVLAAIYPATWGISQLATGPLSDRWGRRWMIIAGMVLQGAALIVIATVRGLGPWSAALIALGLGTALVYPTLIAAVGDFAHPAWRAAAVGVYRLWRDLGYVAGALVAGVLSDALGVSMAISVIGIFTAASGLVFGLRFTEGGS